MNDWLRAKLRALVEVFLQGAGTGHSLEIQYLCYLETLVALEQGPSAANEVWVQWTRICTDASSEIDRLLVEHPLSMAHRIQDRQTLVHLLQTFQKRFEGPTRQWRRGSVNGIIVKDPE